MVQALNLTWLVLAGTIKIRHIIVLSCFLGCINAFDVPARQSFVIQMVDKKEDLGNAIALNSSMVNGARLLGPSIAGTPIVAAGKGVCFLLNALSYLFVIEPLFLMRVDSGNNSASGKPVLDSLPSLFPGFLSYLWS